MTKSFQLQGDISEKEKEKVKGKFTPFLLIPLAFLIIGTGLSSKYFFPFPFSLPLSKEQPLEVSGRIEGYETNIGTKVGGKISFVTVQEGDEVKKNQLIIKLDDGEINAQLKGAKARLISIQQQQMQAQLQINFLESQIQEVNLNLQQAKEDSKGKIFQAQASLAASQSQLNETKAKLEHAQSELKLAQINRDRLSQLIAEGAISQQQFDEAQMTFETAKATVKANQASVESSAKLVKTAEGFLQQAKTSSFNPSIRNAQLNGLQTQLAQARLQLTSTQAEVENSKAFQEEIESKMKYLSVRSTIDGVVITRLVEPGEVVSSGQSLVTILNPKSVYLRGYIPSKYIGKIKVGQKAEVFLDSDPNTPLSATISAIDTQASFTPENIYFKEDRIKQVFGVKISINNPGGFAKPGMPAEAKIITQSENNK